jgi:hypothetical protein
VEQAMRAAWDEVAAEKSRESEPFARLWRLYQDFSG